MLKWAAAEEWCCLFCLFTLALSLAQICPSHISSSLSVSLFHSPVFRILATLGLRFHAGPSASEVDTLQAQQTLNDDAGDDDEPSGQQFLILLRRQVGVPQSFATLPIVRDPRLVVSSRLVSGYITVCMFVCQRSSQSAWPVLGDATSRLHCCHRWRQTESAVAFNARLGLRPFRFAHERAMSNGSK